MMHVLGKDPQPKPVNACSDTGSPAIKKRAQPRIPDVDQEPLVDDQESLEDADHLDLDTSEIVEESQEPVMTHTETPLPSSELDASGLVSHQEESTGTTMSPSPPPTSPLAPLKGVSLHW